ncbi:hypothetical protein Vafri_11576 [Volvox africanus]|nr:hypothetical protein Vafri_11576 [Volvox africanus]
MTSCPSAFEPPVHTHTHTHAHIHTRTHIRTQTHSRGPSEFIRIPGRSENPLGSIRGVASWYEAGELGELPLGAQIMGSNPELMGMAAQYLVKVRGAPRVDLNCGCPANTVTGNGAGSSLLRTPKLLGQVVAAMVQAVGGMAPVSVKLRAGFDDVSLMEDNLLAAQEAGAAFVTLHPRTRRQAYSGHADWGLIGRAVQRLDIPVVGNGDVVSVDRAHQLLRETGCHGLMVGRGAVHDPLIFLRIRHSFTADHGSPEVHAQRKTWQGREHEVVQDFLRAYAGHFIPELGVETPVSGAPGGHGTKPHVPPPRQTQQQQQQTQTQTQTQPTSMDGAICGGCGTPDSASPEEAAAARAFGRVKVVMRYLFASSPQLAAACEELLRRTPRDCSPADLVQELCTQVELGWPRSGGPTRRVLYDHMNKQVRQLVAA